MKLRVVFQGGGARLVHLLAAAQAIENCKTGNFEIERVGGVSAGAIAAAALAVPQDVETTRSRLYANGKDFVKLAEKKTLLMSHLFEKSVTKPDDAILKRHGWQHFRHRVSKLTIVPYHLQRMKFFRELENGETILRHELNQAILDLVFSREKNKPYFFGDLDMDLSVFTSLLKTGEAKVYNNTNTPAMRVGSAVASSASLPFIFSSFKKTGDETDGGIYNELPTQSFLENASDDTRVLAISFKPETRKIDNAVDFGFALLSTSMNASVRESQQIVRDMNGAVLELETNLGVADFSRAFNEELASATFEGTVARIERQIRPILNGVFKNADYRHIRSTRFGRDDVTPMFKVIEAEHPVVWRESKKIYVDKNLRKATNAVQAVKDLRIYTGHLYGPNGKVLGFKMGLPDAFEETDGLNLDVRYEGQKGSLTTEGFITESNESGKKVLSLIVMLSTPIAATRENPLSVTLSLEGDVYAPFHKSGEDFFRFRNRTTDNVESHSFICLLARSIGEVEVGSLFDPSVEDKVRAFVKDYESKKAKFDVGGVSGVCDTDAQLLGTLCGPEMAKEPTVLCWRSEGVERSKFTGCFIRKLRA